MIRNVTIDTNQAGATNMNMRNDELRELSDVVVQEMRYQASGRRIYASFCARIAHSKEEHERAVWEGHCARHKRIACAFWQAAALIEASIGCVK